MLLFVAALRRYDYIRDYYARVIAALMMRCLPRQFDKLMRSMTINANARY